MALHELESSSEVNTFRNSNPNTLICFSATWCGPCKASKPTYESHASTTYMSSGVKCGIAYEHNLGEDIHEFSIRAFPTYVLYVGSKEHGRIEGVDFDGITKMIQEAGCSGMAAAGEGHSLGGGAGAVSQNVSAAEARALRLAMFEKKQPASQPKKDEKQVEDEKVMADASNDTTENTDATTTPADENTTEMEIEDKSEPVQKQAEAQQEPQDVEMKEATAGEDKEVEMVNPTEKLSKEHLETLTGGMGFTLLRAQKGLLYGSGGTLEGAIDWLMAHQDDADIDEPIPLVPKNDGPPPVAKSYKCNATGKIFRSMADLELYANRTGHSDFEESTEEVKPLTAEEKAAKILEIKDLLKAKRMEREQAEKADDISKEISRRNMGKEVAKTKEEMERSARQREAKMRKKEKEAFKKERLRIRAELEKDKAERKAHKGKLTSKLGVDGYNPDAIQYDQKVDDQADPSPAKKKSKASVAKIDDYISKVSSYRAGGDGGKCLKILSLYVKNVVDHPNEEKYKSINMESNAYKTKVKPFVGAKSLLLAIGFSPNDSHDAMVLADDADRDVLASTKAKLIAAHAAY